MPDDGLHSPAGHPQLQRRDISISNCNSNAASNSSETNLNPNLDFSLSSHTSHNTSHRTSRNTSPTSPKLTSRKGSYRPAGPHPTHAESLGITTTASPTSTASNRQRGSAGCSAELPGHFQERERTGTKDNGQDQVKGRPQSNGDTSHPELPNSDLNITPASPSSPSPVSPNPASPHSSSPSAPSTSRPSQPPSKKRRVSPADKDAATEPSHDSDPPMATQQRTGNTGSSNSNNSPNSNNNSSSSNSNTNNGRLTRIRKACDICRMRKVKCDGVSPCKPCQSLGAECTFQYVSRHRGPTSRFAAGGAWSAANSSTANNNTNVTANEDIHIHGNDNAHPNPHNSHGFANDGFGDASDVFAALYMMPQPMTIPQAPPLPEALTSMPTTLPLYRNDSGGMAPSLHPHSPSSVASGASVPSVGSAASPSVQAVPYSNSFFDAVATNARRSPAAPQVHLSHTNTPHINIYPRMPRPQLNRQAVPPPPPPPPPQNPQHQFPPLPPLPLQFNHHGNQQQQSKSKPPLNSDAIAPLHVLELLVDDFYTYIHPLIPFPHEPTFRRRFANADTRQEPGFLALLASMIGCLAASFPRSVRAHLKARASATNDGVPLPGMTGAPFTRAVYMVACCRDVALAARGASFYTKPVLSVDDAATSYFLGLAAGYTFDWHLCRRFMAEAMSFVQELGFHRRQPTAAEAASHSTSVMAAAMAALGSPHGAGAPRRFNHIEDQIGKRIFWILYLAMRSLIQLGATLSETPLPPFNNARPFPELPAEVDDAYIEADVVHPQPVGTVSLITGFNKTIQIYATMDPIATMEYACGLHQVPVAAQRAMCVDALQAAKAITATLPDELYLPLPGSGDETYNANEMLYDDLPGYRYYPPECDDTTTTTSYGATRRDSNRSTLSSGNTGYNYGLDTAPAPAPPAAATPRPDDLRFLLTQQPERRRQVQYDIQKTNIYASQLATRSYYVEMYLHLGEDDTTDNNPMHGERERIVHSLLFVLAAIPQCNMEPNGSALINKIRQVASTLLSVKPKSSTDSSTSSAEAQLVRFLEILMRLERTGGPAGGVMAAMGASGLDSLANMNIPGMSSLGVGGLASMASSMGLTGSSTSAGDDEEEELQSWASLREEQMRFAANGGFLGNYSM